MLATTASPSANYGGGACFELSVASVVPSLTNDHRRCPGGARRRLYAYAHFFSWLPVWRFGEDRLILVRLCAEGVSPPEGRYGKQLALRENESVLNILIVKLSAIGDVIHCLPVAVALKARLPEARISWLVEAASAELLQGNPAVDEVIVFRAKSWLKSSGSPFNWAQTAILATDFVRDLRGRKFDVALEMQGLLKSSLLGFASGAKIRIGFAETRESADRFLTHKVDVGDYFGHYVPVVELNLKIAESLLQVLGKENGKLPAVFTLPAVTDAQTEKVDRLLSHPSIRNGGGEEIPANGKICAIIPGTTWVTKIWPEEKWFELSRRLAHELAYRLLLIGGPAEQKLNSRLSQQLQGEFGSGGVTDVTGQTTLLELAALFKRCDLVIGGDTGPLHLAAAVGLPKVLGIYGSTPWRRLGPYGPQCRSVASGIWCQPCYSKTCAIGAVSCLTDLSVDRVFAAVQELTGVSTNA